MSDETTGIDDPEWLDAIFRELSRRLDARDAEIARLQREREEGAAEAFERAAQDCRGKAADCYALGDYRAARSFEGLADLYEGFVRKSRSTDGDDTGE